MTNYFEFFLRGRVPYMTNYLEFFFRVHPMNYLEFFGR